MNCAQVREALPAHVRDGESLLDVRRHLARCPECRAELERYEALLDGLRGLAAVPAEPPADLLPALIAIPERESRLGAVRSHVARNRTRYIGGAAVAVASVAGAALWHTRSRRLATA